MSDIKNINSENNKASLLPFKWYVLHTHSAKERLVKEAIILELNKHGISDDVQEILVPSMKVAQIRRGEQVSSNKKIMPGYVLVNLRMTDAVQGLITSTPRVSGFLGGKVPKPISDEEVNNIVAQIKSLEDQEEKLVRYAVGDSVHIIDGPFDSFSGVVEDVDNVLSKAKVSVTIFGRVTPIELSFSQIEKNVNRG